MVLSLMVPTKTRKLATQINGVTDHVNFCQPALIEFESIEGDNGFIFVNVHVVLMCTSVH